MTKGEKDLKKVQDSIRGAAFLGSSVVTIDIDTLERAFDARYEQGRESMEQVKQFNDGDGDGVLH